MYEVAREETQKSEEGAPHGGVHDTPQQAVAGSVQRLGISVDAGRLNQKENHGRHHNDKSRHCNGWEQPFSISPEFYQEPVFDLRRWRQLICPLTQESRLHEKKYQHNGNKWNHGGCCGLEIIKGRKSDEAFHWEDRVSEEMRHTEFPEAQEEDQNSGEQHTGENHGNRDPLHDLAPSGNHPSGLFQTGVDGPQKNHGEEHGYGQKD